MAAAPVKAEGKVKVAYSSASTREELYTSHKLVMHTSTLCTQVAYLSQKLLPHVTRNGVGEKLATYICLPITL
jgi:hypothetical protein